jgi:hypothetical protein
VQNTLKAAVVVDEKMSVKEYAFGDGKIIYCPLPLELAADDKAACALYRYAVESAQAQNRIYSVINSEGKENFEIYAIVYPECTVYTIINDGPAAELELLDNRSGKVLQFNFADLGMAKIWVGTDGNILNEYVSEWSVRL